MELNFGESRCDDSPSNERIHQGSPLFIEFWPLETATRAGVPVVSIRKSPFLAMQVGVNRHAVLRLEFIDEAVGMLPIAPGIPPEGGARSRPTWRWRVGRYGVK